jgi:hypothetical protein
MLTSAFHWVSVRLGIGDLVGIAFAGTTLAIGISPFKPRLIQSRSLPNLLESRSPLCALEGHASPNKFVTAIQVNNYSVGN